jgi:hypothetical protein
MKGFLSAEIAGKNSNIDEEKFIHKVFSYIKLLEKTIRETTHRKKEQHIFYKYPSHSDIHTYIYPISKHFKDEGFIFEHDEESRTIFISWKHKYKLHYNKLIEKYENTRKRLYIGPPNVSEIIEKKNSY